MYSTAIIIFREILEIAMILGVVLAATRGLPGRAVWIGTGFAGGLLGAGIVALFAEAISNAASGMGQEFFNACILFTAATVIGWTAIWMRSHAREFVVELKHAGKEVAAGRLPGFSLSLIIGLAILREGSEIVLFIYGMVLSGQTPASIVMGSILGLALGTITGVLLYLGLVKMSARYMLKVTGWLLVLLVAGLSSQGAGYLNAAGYFSGLSMPVWNTSWLLSQGSGLGKALHSLIGYSERPSAIEVIFYCATLLGLLFIMAIMDRRKGGHSATVAASS
jgi:high-affinity iron transporter